MNDEEVAGSHCCVMPATPGTKGLSGIGNGRECSSSSAVGGLGKLSIALLIRCVAK